MRLTRQKSQKIHHFLTKQLQSNDFPFQHGNGFPPPKLKAEASRLQCSCLSITPNFTYHFADDNLSCERTLKYFQGIAAGKWVISSQWVHDSLSASRLLPQEKYEIRGDSVNGRNHCGPMRSRLWKGPPLLGEYNFFCLEPYTGLSKDSIIDYYEIYYKLYILMIRNAMRTWFFSRKVSNEFNGKYEMIKPKERRIVCVGVTIKLEEQLEATPQHDLTSTGRIIDEQGGSVYSHLSELPRDGNEKESLIIAQSGAQETDDDYNALYQKYQIKIISREWVLDSIAIFTAQPIATYLLCDVARTIILTNWRRR
ncbi:hypothetical protein BSL78_21236 [Apostichopus japonicus]|uniref:BRCT domain-containing protein n=1 Tax=Stichopus japonicus TaxID=307972 RepID=A0A2G8K1P6_STIJA|nr:hypothetical protein BSL78_21236 [Apostichopus japonicus]